jgi:flagellar hook-basal body complex protein FliE
MDPLTATRLAGLPMQQALTPQRLEPSNIPVVELEKLGAQQPLPAAGASGSSFSNVLGNLVQEVNAKQIAANETVNGLLSGQNVSLHQTMIAMEEASVSFQLMVEVRNKLLESYQELMRMQV